MNFNNKKQSLKWIDSSTTAKLEKNKCQILTTYLSHKLQLIQQFLNVFIWSKQVYLVSK